MLRPLPQASNTMQSVNALGMLNTERAHEDMVIIFEKKYLLGPIRRGKEAHHILPSQDQNLVSPIVQIEQTRQIHVLIEPNPYVSVVDLVVAKILNKFSIGKVLQFLQGRAKILFQSGVKIFTIYLQLGKPGVQNQDIC